VAVWICLSPLLEAANTPLNITVISEQKTSRVAGSPSQLVSPPLPLSYCPRFLWVSPELHTHSFVDAHACIHKHTCACRSPKNFK